MTVCLCESATRVRYILEDSGSTGKHIKNIILIRKCEELDALREEAKAHEIQLHTFDEIMVGFISLLFDIPLRRTPSPI